MKIPGKIIQIVIIQSTEATAASLIAITEDGKLYVANDIAEYAYIPEQVTWKEIARTMEEE